MSRVKIPFHFQILIGMVAGALFGLLAARVGWSWLVIDWIKPWGTIFINLLKLIAVPLIVTSLIKGVSDLQDITKLSRMGGRTFLLFIATTCLAITVGLVVVNLVQPGSLIREETRVEMLAKFGGDAAGRISAAEKQSQQGPLQPLVDIVPENLFAAASSNGQMLQVIFFVIFFGVGLVLVPAESRIPVKAFFDGANAVVLKLIDLIMLAAPFGVFALLSSLMVEFQSVDFLVALLGYAGCVVGGILLLLFVIYPGIVWFFTGRSYLSFLRGVAPAQLLAFSTSSSAATLPVTLDCARERLGVDDEVASFVLPIGATVNMDGTALYQGVAAVFIGQAFGLELGLMDQLSIILTATLASIGSAAVPGAGMVMLVIVLQEVGIPVEGLALIMAIDRPLDMCRTAANVTSDSAVSMVIAQKFGLLHEPPPVDA